MIETKSDGVEMSMKCETHQLDRIFMAFISFRSIEYQFIQYKRYTST
jgi:hypothetical protein